MRAGPAGYSQSTYPPPLTFLGIQTVNLALQNIFQLSILREEILDL